MHDTLFKKTKTKKQTFAIWLVVNLILKMHPGLFSYSQQAFGEFMQILFYFETPEV